MVYDARRSSSGRGRASVALFGLLLLGCSSGPGSAEAGTSTTAGPDAGTSGTDGAAPTSTSGDPSATTTGEVATTGGTATTGTATTGDATTGDATTGCVAPEETTGEGPPPVGSLQEYLVAECEAFVGCGCVAPDEFGVDMATCLATRGAELAAVAAQGYAWDPECAAVRLAGLADACAGGDGAYTCEMFACTLFHGEVGYGEKCEVTIGSTDWWDGTTCAAGLACQGLCVPRCGDLVTCGLEICAPGQVCYDIDDIGLMCGSASGPGEACYPGTMACQYGLVCTADDVDVYTCKVEAGACEACGLCAEGLYCAEGSQVCVPRVAQGEACASDEACESEACGPGGVCEAWPGEGEMCPHHRCADGLACANTGTCVPAAQRGEACKQLDNCAPGLLCFFEDYCELLVCGVA